MASLDATVVGIALPRIGKDFNTGVSSLQWVVTAYTLTLAAFLLLGGTLGDHYGRRRVFVIGVIWFAVASGGCAAAPTAGTLIIARALQGVGAALLTPGSLAILQSAFDPEDRSRAIGAWSGLGALATAAGPLVGGYLLSVGSWRLVFLLNLPLALVVLAVTRRHVPESTDSSASGHIDIPGAMWAVIALSTVTYALIEAPGIGWGSPTVVGCLGVAVVAAIGFVMTERRSVAPMLPPSMFLSRQFAATNAVTFLLYGALSGALFLLPVVLQEVAGYTPLRAGLTLLPVTILMLALSARSGRLASRLGPRLQMSTGPLVAGAGIVLLVRLTGDHHYLSGVLPGVFVLGIGLVITVAPLTSTAMSSAPGEHAGLASAVNNDVARAAGLFAVAILPVVSGLTGDAYLHPTTFAHGFRIACLICGALCGLGGVLAAVTISNSDRSGPSLHPPLTQPCAGATTPPLVAPTGASVAHDGGMAAESSDRPPLDVVVTNNTDVGQYEARIDGVLAGFTTYVLHDDRVVFTHAETYPRWEGQGVGSALARAALDDVIASGKTITPLCPFIVNFVKRNPSYLPNVDEVHRLEIEALIAAD